MNVVLTTVIYLALFENVCCHNEIPLVILEKTSVRGVCISLTDSVSHISDGPLIFNNTVSHSSSAAIIPPSLTLNEDSNADILNVFSFLSAMKLQQCLKLIANAFIELMRYYRWRDLIILSDSSHSFYVRTGQYLYKEALHNMFAVDYIQVKKDFSDMDILQNVANQSKRIIFLSMPSNMVVKGLHVRRTHSMNWREYAWIVHSVYKDSTNENLYDGIIELQANIKFSSESYSSLSEYFNESCKSLPHVSKSVDLYWLHHGGTLHLSNYSEAAGYYHITPELQVPHDSTLSPVPIVFSALFALCILVCFVSVTFTLALYIRFRKEPAIKATSTSLSCLIFIGCYAWIFYLCILNITLLPGYHKRASSTRNAMCLLRMWLHGLGYPVVLIMCTTLVKMIRIYRIFYCQGRLNKYMSGNFALALYALILTSPNALICLTWLIRDPYLSYLYYTTIDGHRHVMERCHSETAIRFLLGLLVHIILLALALLITAIKTKHIMLADFKNSSKIRVFSLFFFLTTSIGLFYWYVLNIVVKANDILVHASLQISHYCLIFQILGLLFLPKLYPILKYKWMKKHSIPLTKSLFSSMEQQTEKLD